MEKIYINTSGEYMYTNGWQEHQLKCPVCHVPITAENADVYENRDANSPAYKQGAYRYDVVHYKNYVCKKCRNKLEINSTIVHLVTWGLTILMGVLTNHLIESQTTALQIIGFIMLIPSGLMGLGIIGSVIFQSDAIYEIVGAILNLKWKLNRYDYMIP